MISLSVFVSFQRWQNIDPHSTCGFFLFWASILVYAIGSNHMSFCNGHLIHFRLQMHINEDKGSPSKTNITTLQQFSLLPAFFPGAIIKRREKLYFPQRKRLFRRKMVLFCQRNIFAGKGWYVTGEFLLLPAKSNVWPAVYYSRRKRPDFLPAR